MSAHISELFLHPVKGLRGLPQHKLNISTIFGVEGDRRAAYAKGLLPPEGWQRKAAFYVGMNTPGMAAIDPQGDTETLVLQVAKAAKAVKSREPVEVCLAHAGTAYNLTDTNPFAFGPTVSLLNLATVRAFSEFVGQEIDPRRFRMNVWVEGLAPFAELKWLTQQQIGLGTDDLQCLEFELIDHCERCKAIEANPATGERDLELVRKLAEFMEHYQTNYRSPQRGVRTVMGTLLKPLQDGQIRIHDSVFI